MTAGPSLGLDHARSEVAAGMDGDVGFIADPFPALAVLREHAPVCRLGGRGVFVFRYDDIDELLPARAGLKRGLRGGPRHPADAAGEHRRQSEELRTWGANWLVESDGEQHQRLRALVRGAFTPRVVRQLRDRIDSHVERLLDEMGEAGPVVDFAEHFGLMLPLTVVCEMLDIRPEDHTVIRDWARDYGRALRGNGRAETVASAYAGMMQLRRYMTDVVQERRSGGTDSAILQALFDAEAGEEHLSSEELVTMMVHLFFGGHETTANLLSGGLLALLDEREQWDLLCARPELIETAIEELLRVQPSVMVIERMFMESREIRGLTVEPEETITLVLAAGNRDPEMFAEPERIDIARTGPKHLSFGHGPHFCLGAFLNRLEVESAFASLSRRFPDLSLAVPRQTIEWWPSLNLRGIKKLPIRLGSDRG